MMFDDLPRGIAGVILIDCPWWFGTWSPKGWKKSAHAQYGCMSLDDIKALPVEELAAPDCALVMYGTQNAAEHMWPVAREWSFTPIALGAWAKQSSTGRKWAFGTGYLLRSAAEFFLVAERGKPARLSKSQRNLIVAPVRGHSRKPDAMYELCESLWPGPYVELFARYRRVGWLQSGDQLESQQQMEVKHDGRADCTNRAATDMAGTDREL
jgi:N6-adenosine-specific RNA methylase IME4